MQSVAVTRCVSVTGGHADKTPWVISNFESINGVEYIPLSMRDSGFNRFVAGAGSRGICGKSGDFLTKLRELRATATHVGKSESDALFTPTAAAIKKQRLMSREASKRGELPATVEIEAPGFVSDGVQVEPMKLIVKSSLHVSDMLWVQATGPVLEYIKAGVRSQLGQERVGTRLIIIAVYVGKRIDAVGLPPARRTASVCTRPSGPKATTRRTSSMLCGWRGSG